MLYFLLCFFLFVCSSLSPVLAQRVVATVRAPEGQELLFDVNQSPLTTLPLSSVPELNFSPNIVFTRDSSRAFVSYPGSARVVAFNGVTGAIESIIQVGSNPALLTLTPDGRKIAVVSLFLRENVPQGSDFRGQRIGSVSIIDVETFEVRTLNLSEVFFSFANNVEFSADSKTGYVASSGTDELIRFDVDTATEMTPRLKFEGGTRPSSITAAPDRSYLAVVLVGSSILPQLESPDSIQIIDPGSFTIRRGIVPPPLEVARNDGSTFRFPHDFHADNNLAISADGKLGVIADRENGLASGIPELGSDHALLIDLEAGTVMRVLSIGGAGGAAAVSPTLNRFVVISAIDVAFIDPANELVIRTSSSQSQFRATGRPAFSHDGTALFEASPIQDVILRYDIRTGSVRNLSVTGRDFERPSPQIPAGTLHLTLSPDGQILAALNFNANTIDLLKNTTRIAIPEFSSTAEWFTGIALTNPSDQPAEIIAGGVAENGAVFRDDPATEDVVEFVNPQTITLSPGTQRAFTARELIETADGLSFRGWLDLDSDRSEITGFFLTGDPVVKRLDGGLATQQQATVLVLPEVHVSNGFQTELIILNSNFNGALVRITLLNSMGENVADLTRTVGSGTQLRRFLIDPDLTNNVEEGLFDAEDFEEDESYYIVVSSEAGIQAYERYYDAERLAALNGFAIAGPEIGQVSRLVAPQVVALGGMQSTLSVVNLNAEKIGLTLTLRGNDGGNLAAPVMVELENAQMLKQGVAQLFQLPENAAPVSGWVLVESDKPGISGDVEIRLFDGKALTAVPLQAQGATRLVFSHIAEGRGFSTGLGLVNAGADPAVSTVRIHRMDGTLVASTQIALGAGQRRVELLSDLFAGLPELIGGYIDVVSDQPVIGLELFFTNDQETLSVVPAQRIQQN